MLNVANDYQLSVPIPRPTQYVYRGMKSTKIPTTHPISIRWTEEDQRFIDQQAGRIGITFSEFVRWVAYHAALEVNRLDYVSSFNMSGPDDSVKKEIESFDDWE